MAIIVAKSESEDDLKLAARRLSSKRDQEKLITCSLKDCFGFLDRSANLSQSEIHSDASYDTVLVTEEPDVIPVLGLGSDERR